MKRGEKFRCQGRCYKFLDWADDGSARAVDLQTNKEVWLSSAALTQHVSELTTNTGQRKLVENELQAQQRIRAELDQMLSHCAALRAQMLLALIEDQASNRH